MGGVAFRMSFGSRPATVEELGRMEEIVVEQEMDMAWEARIRLYMCLDENGQWKHGAHEFAEPFSRVRVELDPGSGSWVPLIDGPVTGFEHGLDSQPGQSGVSLVVRDDSVLLDREEIEEVFENQADGDIARTVLGRFAEIASPPRVQSPAGAARPSVVRRGTAIQFLRELARPHEYHAYVLPGAIAGQSIGCFLPDPATPGTLPPLVMLGADRNLADADVREDSAAPATARASALADGDQQVQQSQTGVQDVSLMRANAPVTVNLAAIRLVRPEDNDRIDPTARTEGAARRSAYAYRVTARVVPGCYSAALAPYERVTVRVGNLPLSGEWLITKVTHRITPSVWTQEFEAKCDSREATDAGDAVAGAAGLSVSASASFSLF